MKVLMKVVFVYASYCNPIDKSGKKTEYEVK